jgi:hypothetical protein
LTKLAGITFIINILQLIDDLVLEILSFLIESNAQFE